MSAKHQVYPGCIQDRNKQFVCVKRAMPGVADRRNVDNRYFKRSCAEFFARGHLLQPDGLFFPVEVESSGSQIFDIVIRFIFASVQNDKEYGSLTETIIRFTGTGGEIIDVTGSVNTSGFVISP